ncbi:MAG: NUDIX domain-containing protein [Clostridiales bacterium]|nr:NUDIX domain-containing protein [Clostridiales bacterium]
MKQYNSELFPIVNLNGTVIGKATRGECHSGSMLLHPVVHLHIVDCDGRIFLQKRSMNKDIQPGRWDTAVGGHVDYNESVENALARETREELGIEINEKFHLVTYDFRSDREHELVHAYCMIVDSDDFSPVYNRDEIDDARFWSGDEIDAVKGKGILTPNFESEYDRLKALIYELL